MLFFVLFVSCIEQRQKRQCFSWFFDDCYWTRQTRLCLAFLLIWIPSSSDWRDWSQPLQSELDGIQLIENAEKAKPFQPLFNNNCWKRRTSTGLFNICFISIIKQTEKAEAFLSFVQYQLLTTTIQITAFYVFVADWVWPRALTLIAWLICNWKWMEFNMIPLWSSRAHSVIDV